VIAENAGFDHLSALSIEDERWLPFLQKCPGANIFHQPAWSRLLVKAYGCRIWVAALLDESGLIRGGVPVACVNRPLAGRSWVSLPFTDHCSPLSLSDEDAQLFVDGLLEMNRLENHPKLELRWQYPYRQPLASPAEYVFHQIELSENFDEVIGRIHSMHNRNTRLAVRNGVKVELGSSLTDVREFYGLHRLTRKRQGVPVQPWRFFSFLWSELIDQQHGFLLMARHEGRLVGGAVFLHAGDTLTYKFGASDARWFKLRPNDLIFYEGIRWGCENGYRWLDLGRTDCGNTGLREFKTRWGAQEIPLYYTYSITKTKANHPAHWATGALAKALEKVIRASPVWVCQATGELLYRFTA
jgi:hypothetical protein